MYAKAIIEEGQTIMANIIRMYTVFLDFGQT
jgi:hypothetical protein